MPRGACFGQPVEAAAQSLHIVEIGSLHRGISCYEPGLGANSYSIIATLHVLRIPVCMARVYYNYVRVYNRAHKSVARFGVNKAYNRHARMSKRGDRNMTTDSVLGSGYAD